MTARDWMNACRDRVSLHSAVQERLLSPGSALGWALGAKQ